MVVWSLLLSEVAFLLLSVLVVSSSTAVGVLLSALVVCSSIVSLLLVVAVSLSLSVYVDASTFSAFVDPASLCLPSLLVVVPS